MPERVILDLDVTSWTAHLRQGAGRWQLPARLRLPPAALAYEAETEEALAAVLRPGNAGANTAADHITVLDAAVEQLPEQAR